MKKEKIILFFVIPIGLLILFSGMLADRYIHSQGFADPQRTSSAERLSLTGNININTATVDELDTLPGVGPAIAKRIIEYREKNGPFQSLYDIAAVDGIGPATIIKFIHLIRLEDPK